MNNIFKFAAGIFATLAFAWLSFVVGAGMQYGDLSPEAERLEDDGSRPEGADLFPVALSGMAQQGAKEYLALGCMTCHTQQVRLFWEKGPKKTPVYVPSFDVERGWGDRPSMARDYVLQEHVMIGNTRIGPDLANLGLREHSDAWLHQHLFEPQSLVPESVCPPSPFLYDVINGEAEGSIQVSTSDDDEVRHVFPSLRANRIVAYLQALKQNYELPEMSFFEKANDADSKVASSSQVVDSNQSGGGVPDWLAKQMASGKEIYMKAGTGGGMCFTCHQATGLGLAGQFPPLADSDWVLGDKGRLIKISMYGLMGEIEVNGEKYNNAMPPPGIPPGSLTDGQIADVLTYIRNAWGNSASAVSPSEVAAVRASVKGRAPMQMWTAAELSTNSKPEND
mgnify:FL=1